MANEEKKDFNAMLHRANGMPKVQLVTDEATVKKYGGTRMYFAPPLAYDTLMRQVPPGRLTTVGELRALLARRALADFTDPITIVARGRTNIRYFVQGYENKLWVFA